MTNETRTMLTDAVDVLAKIAIAGVVGLWVLYTYPESRERDFRKTYWERQTSLYFEAVQTTATIATLPKGDPGRDKAEKAFWTLYWGEMTVVEAKCEPSDPVDQAMILFGRCLTKPDGTAADEECNLPALQQRSIKLGKAERDSIGRSWDETLGLLRQGCASSL